MAYLGMVATDDWEPEGHMMTADHRYIYLTFHPFVGHPVQRKERLKFFLVAQPRGAPNITFTRTAKVICYNFHVC